MRRLSLSVLAVFMILPTLTRLQETSPTTTSEEETTSTTIFDETSTSTTIIEPENTEPELPPTTVPVPDTTTQSDTTIQVPELELNNEPVEEILPTTTTVPDDGYDYEQYEDGEVEILEPFEETTDSIEQERIRQQQEAERQIILEAYRIQLEESYAAAAVISQQITTKETSVKIFEQDIIEHSAIIDSINAEILLLESNIAKTEDLRDDLREQLSNGSVNFFMQGSNSTPILLGDESINDKFVLEQSQAHWFEQVLNDVESANETIELDVMTINNKITSSELIAQEITFKEELISDISIEITNLNEQKEALLYGTSTEVIQGIFPIAGEYGKPFDSWGFPRSGGRTHKGIDIFAPYGTPLVAIETGTITRIGTVNLGGQRIWLEGDSGTHWYYAHLSDYAEGLYVGQRVDPGDLVGYVGDSGNAKGTPPHLHLQQHPNGGTPINPYPAMRFLHDARKISLEVYKSFDSENVD